eukprot:symbB.v1.2.012328.t1/scaffold846.1/size158211/14
MIFAFRSFEESEPPSPRNGWHLAKALVIRGGQGAIMQLAGGKHKAWLPQEQIRPLEEAPKFDGNSEREDSSSDVQKASQNGKVTREQRLRDLRNDYNPTQWIQGIVASVKPFGIFVDIFEDIQVLVYIHSIPEAMIERLPGGPRAGDRVPDFEKGDEVELRICGYHGQELFVCSMLPPSMDKPEVEKGKGGKGEKGEKGAKSQGKGSKGKHKDGKGAKGKEASGYSVWVPDRFLESETTLARQEQFEVNALNAQLVEEQYGQGDRRAALARKGFTVVDYATSLQLSQVFKAKSEPKDVATPLQSILQSTREWSYQRKLIGKIQTMASMTTSEKERLAVDLAMTEYNDVIQAGANVQKVDVNFDRVLIRLFADAGIQF